MHCLSDPKNMKKRGRQKSDMLRQDRSRVEAQVQFEAENGRNGTPPPALKFIFGPRKVPTTALGGTAKSLVLLQ